MFERGALYVLVLVCYVPGLYNAIRYRTLLHFPLLTCCFFGLFFENALGSILVFFPELTDRVDYFSMDYVGMLVAQAAIFYAVVAPYLSVVRRARHPFVHDWSADRTLLAVMLVTILGISIVYFNTVGPPTLVQILRGELDESSVVSYRIQGTYGLEDYSVYNLGLTTLPMLAAVLAYALAFIRKQNAILEYAAIGSCVVVLLLPGFKGMMFDLVTTLFIAYMLLCGGRTSAGYRVVRIGRIVAALCVAFVPVFAMYKVYFGSLRSTGQLVIDMLYRIFGINSESMAAAVWYIKTHGVFGTRALPTIRGLFPHSQLNVSDEMHVFLFGPGGGAPVSALTEGYLMFGWAGFVAMAVIVFVIVIAAEEFFRRGPRNLLLFSLLVLYGLFATKVSQLSIFATFISLTYGGAFFTLVLFRSMLAWLLSRARLGRLAATNGTQPRPPGGPVPDS